jgi:hypothetical protein
LTGDLSDFATEHTWDFHMTKIDLRAKSQIKLISLSKVRTEVCNDASTISQSKVRTEVVTMQDPISIFS